MSMHTWIDNIFIVWSSRSMCFDKLIVVKVKLVVLMVLLFVFESYKKNVTAELWVTFNSDNFVIITLCILNLLTHKKQPVSIKVKKYKFNPFWWLVESRLCDYFCLLPQNFELVARTYEWYFMSLRVEFE